MQETELLTVVVADDEPELLHAVCQLIDWQALGFRLVGQAGNGLDALQLVEQMQPDFLLTDIRMPFISGTELARQAREVQPLIQVAFLSGYDDFEYAKQGIENEIVAYLLKPISMAELTQELGRIRTRIRRRLDDLTRGRSGGEARELLTATMLLDPYLQPQMAQTLAQAQSLGFPIREDDHIRVLALHPAAAQPSGQELLAAAEIILSRAYACGGFCSGGRVLVLTSAAGGFGQLYSAIDELRQAVRRRWKTELDIGISKEFSTPAECHAAYLDAMQALGLAQQAGGLYASDGWDNIDQLCARAVQMVEKEYMDESMSLQLVSDRLHVSANYLGANLKRFAGDSFMNLLIKRRMTAALGLLRTDGIRIAEIARRCGYTDQSYFGYCFKKYYGMSPARMRQEAGREGKQA